MSQDIAELRAKICRLGALLFERGLTDAAGGNISARAGNQVCMTPRFAGSRFQWQLRPEQVLVIDGQGRVLEGEGEPSREARVHLVALSRIPAGGAMIHAHSRHALTFCALGMPIHPVLDTGLKLGTVGLVRGAPAHSQELAEQVAQALAVEQDRIAQYAAAVLAPRHGVFVMGRDLDAAFDGIERVETNARCALEMAGTLWGNVRKPLTPADSVVRPHTSSLDSLTSPRNRKRVLTVTPNTTIDRVIFIPEFGWGRTIRADSSVIATGGKPEDVSYILGELGYPSLALGFAAGPTGERVEALLREKGVEVDLTWVGGESRTNDVIIWAAGGLQSTIVVDTLDVSRGHIEEMRRKVHDALPSASCLVLGGTLPRGVPAELYHELLREARNAGVPTLLDSSGSGMRSGLEGRPTLIKPNRDELQEISGRPIDRLDQAVAAAQALVEKTGAMVVASLGEWGAIGADTQGTWFAPPLDVKPVNTAGAGDGVLAGMAIALSSGLAMQEGLKLGCAIAAAILIRPGTAECQRADVDEFLAKVELQRLA